MMSRIVECMFDFVLTGMHYRLVFNNLTTLEDMERVGRWIRALREGAPTQGKTPLTSVQWRTVRRSSVITRVNGSL